MSSGQFYWCLEHSRVEVDGDESHDKQLGPFPTREAAQNWKQTYAARNEQWDHDTEDPDAVD